MTAIGSFLRRLHADRAGAMAVEFVLVLPLFLLFVLFTVETSRFLYSRAELSFAVHAMSRDALLADSIDRTQLTDRLVQRFSVLQRDQLQSVDVSETVNPDHTRWVAIAVAYRFEFLLPSLVGKDSILLASNDRFLRE
jgi:Flp pilus assembly protein TadG